MLDIYIPTYGRHEKLPAIRTQIDEATTYPHRVFFIVERDDSKSFEMCREHHLYYILNHRSPSYAGAINSAWDCLKSDEFFAGADDLVFTSGWREAMQEKIEQGFQVIGTADALPNQGGNEEVARGEHATHYLVLGEYIKTQGGVINSTEPVLPEVYDHNYTDREFIGTAKFRNVFTPCLQSLVIHNHYSFGKSQMDDTYRKTIRRASADEAVYQQRRPSWNGL